MNNDALIAKIIRDLCELDPSPLTGHNTLIVAVEDVQQVLAAALAQIESAQADTPRAVSVGTVPRYNLAMHQQKASMVRFEFGYWVAYQDYAALANKTVSVDALRQLEQRWRDYAGLLDPTKCEENGIVMNVTEHHADELKETLIELGIKP